MIKINAHIAKKMPLPGTQYASQQYGASLEIEVADSSKPEEIKAKLRALYGVISASIDEQMVNNRQPERGTESVKPATSRVATASTNNQSRTILATDAQKRAISTICHRIGIAESKALSSVGAVSLERLTIKQASQIIDALKARQNGGGR